MRAASEGSLPPTGWTALAPRRARGAERKGRASLPVHRRWGRVGAFMLKGDQERIQRRDYEGGGEDKRVTWGQVMWRNKEGYSIEP